MSQVFAVLDMRYPRRPGPFTLRRRVGQIDITDAVPSPWAVHKHGCAVKQFLLYNSPPAASDHKVQAEFSKESFDSPQKLVL